MLPGFHIFVQTRMEMLKKKHEYTGGLNRPKNDLTTVSRNHKKNYNDEKRNMSKDVTCVIHDGNPTV